LPEKILRARRREAEAAGMLARSAQRRNLVKSLTLTLFLSASLASPRANAAVWQPAAGAVQTPLWPGNAPDLAPVPGSESMTVDTKHLLAGKPVTALTNITRPTMTVYAPKGTNTGAAVVVFPGGGFQILAMDLEGTEVCDWLTSTGVTCVLLKYRVPGKPYDWRCDCRPHNLEVPVPALQDAQRALSLVRFHAAEWHIDPHRIGVLGFSAGGFLVAEVSTRFERRAYAPVDVADKTSSRPDFAVAIYPGHLATDKNALNPNVPVTRDTPPTFLVQAEDDSVDGVKQALVYYQALKNAGVPAEMHLYAQGGHAFGLRKTPLSITGWPRLVETWLRTIGVVRGRFAPGCRQRRSHRPWQFPPTSLSNGFTGDREAGAWTRICCRARTSATDVPRRARCRCAARLAHRAAAPCRR
jgi:acetyl esterase/lipase